MWATGEGNRLNVHGSVAFPHSLGLYYTAMSQYLGFWKFGDEYKVMGLAAFGKPNYYDQMRQLIHLLPGGQFRLDLNALVYHWGRERMFSDSFTKLFGPPRLEGEPLDDRRFADIAHSAQLVLEDACIHIAREAENRTHIRNLCLAGGVALNGCMIKRLREETHFENIHIPPSPDDAGTAVGCALLLSRLLANTSERVSCEAFTGPEYQDSACRDALEKSGIPFNQCYVPEVCAALEIASGKVVAWFQGRMEFGPRALGNRSILADPRIPSMKDWLNQKIKHRELFRPFAASIIEEQATQFFQLHHPAPYMIEVCDVKPEKQDVVPAITHVDGTCRPQTVNFSDNPKFWRLLKEFEKQTGIPLILNTSFNVAGSPIVCSPSQAIETFVSTGIDVLFLGDYVARKSDHSSDTTS
jgi:carbamoyltransferase